VDFFCARRIYFDAYGGQTFYDVEAIDNCCDNSGMKWLYPASGKGVHSGCDKFPCDGCIRCRMMCRRGV
jgi:hypothetical protein